jgi:hypothetical protein
MKVPSKLVDYLKLQRCTNIQRYANLSYFGGRPVFFYFPSSRNKIFDTAIWLLHIIRPYY